jgi:hypothetical protein
VSPNNLAEPERSQVAGERGYLHPVSGNVLLLALSVGKR